MDIKRARVANEEESKMKQIIKLPVGPCNISDDEDYESEGEVEDQESSCESDDVGNTNKI